MGFTLDFTFYSLKEILPMKLKGPIQIVSDFLNIFDHEIKTYNYFPIPIIKNPQRKTPSFVKKLNNFVKKYAPQNPNVHRLRKFFEKLDEGECFLFCLQKW